jgi:hypothetical protein
VPNQVVAAPQGNCAESSCGGSAAQLCRIKLAILKSTEIGGALFCDLEIGRAAREAVLPGDGTTVSAKWAASNDSTFDTSRARFCPETEQVMAEGAADLPTCSSSRRNHRVGIGSSRAGKVRLRSDDFRDVLC